MNFPFGKAVTHDVLSNALLPLVSKYNLATQTVPRNVTTVASAQWVNMQVAGGENRFSLFSQDNLTNEQIQALTADLYNAFNLAMSGQV